MVHSEKPILQHKQKQLLKLLYKYRFGTRELIAQADRRRDEVSLYRSLEVLVRDGVVGKLYDSSFRLQGKAAVYFLTVQGARRLQATGKEIDERILRYGNRTYSDAFVTACLDTFRAALALRRLHPQVKFYTGRQTKDSWYVPDRPPDGFVSLRKEPIRPGQIPDRFFLELLPPIAQRQELRKRLRGTIEFFESDTLQQAGVALPTLLFVCSSDKLELAAQRQIRRLLQHSMITDPNVYTTTLERLTAATADHATIWSDDVELTDHYALDSLPDTRTDVVDTLQN